MWLPVSATSGASGVANSLPGRIPGASGASGGGALKTTWKMRGRLDGHKLVIWLPSMVSFPTVEETGVACGVFGQPPPREPKNTAQAIR